MRSALLSAAGAAALLAAAPAAADDAADLDPVTVIGTRTEKPASEVPATVSVITAEDLERQLANDIKDLVRYEPGVSVRSSPARFGAALGTTGRDGNAGFNIRGLEGNRVLIQVDGVRTPDAFTFGAQSVGRGDYGDLDLLKRVEILRGPASALYGSDGLAGAVSFTTKDPADVLGEGEAVGGRLRGTYASADDSWSGTALVAGRQGRLSGLLAYTRREGREQETQGENEAASSDRTAANPQDWRSDALLGKLVFEPAPGHRLRLTGEHFERDLSADVLSGIAEPPLAAASVLRLLADDATERDRLSLDYRWEPATGPVERLEAALYGQTSTTVQFTFEDRNTAADRTRRNTFDNEVLGGSVQLDARLAAGGLAHRLTIGADASVTRQEGVRDGTVPPAGEPFPIRAFPNTDYALVGVFAQDELALFGGALTLYPALRYDWYDLDPEPDALLPPFTPAGSSDGHLSPKLGLVFRASDTIRLFANYAHGFKAPAPSQVNNAFANPIQNYRSLPNPDLKPETSRTFEAGARWTSGAWSADLTGFAGEYDDFIEQVMVGGSFTPTDPAVYQYVNLGKVEIRGLEARARAEFANGFGGFATVSYARGDVVSGPAKTPLDTIDPVKVTGGVSWREPAGRYGAELFVTHARQKPASRVAQACTPACFTPPDFTVLDLTAFWRVTDAVILRAGAFNLTDETYWWWSDVRGLSSTAVARDAYTQPGRNFSLSLSYDF
ncbi:TonB-dependent hemoglobin/transferrin/lactoferrin family receptor [Phenylobacterium sp.]|uniref:TonB-dependent hemoglobin/transferrin/lactoferrin family receptor n=1 Tax=Phenylobacterium sp. TaxID=1871053 RepID=UPI0035AE6748